MESASDINSVVLKLEISLSHLGDYSWAIKIINDGLVSDEKYAQDKIICGDQSIRNTPLGFAHNLQSPQRRLRIKSNNTEESVIVNSRQDTPFNFTTDYKTGILLIGS